MGDTDSCPILQLSGADMLPGRIVSFLIFSPVIVRTFKEALNRREIEGLIGLIGVSTILNPVAWSYYLVMIFIPLVAAVSCYNVNSQSQIFKNLLIIICTILLFLPDYCLVKSLLMSSGMMTGFFILSNFFIAFLVVLLTMFLPKRGG